MRARQLSLAIVAVTLLVAALAGQASSRAAATATLQASGAIRGELKLSGAGCIVPVNPTSTQLHKRYVIMHFSKAGATITVTIDAWQTGKINLATTKTDSVAVASDSSTAQSAWFGGWTGTQAPELSPNGKAEGSGTMTIAKGGHAGTINVTLTASQLGKNKKPLHLKGHWTGC